jgi:hypothetical protein
VDNKMKKFVVVRCGQNYVRGDMSAVELFSFDSSPRAVSYYSSFEYPEELDTAVSLGYADWIRCDQVLDTDKNTNTRLLIILEGLLRKGDVEEARSQIAKYLNKRHEINE